MVQIAQWLASVGMTPGAVGIWTGVAMLAVWLLREWRETRKLTDADKMARREGYARQVEMLMGENRSMLKDQRELREEYDRYREMCRSETDELRGKILRLENEQTGYKRRLDAQSIELARLKGLDIGDRMLGLDQQ